MQVSDMMRTGVLTVPPDTPFEKLLVMQACTASRQVHVVDGEGRLLGVVTSYDLLSVMAPFYIDSNLARALPDSASVTRHAFEANKALTAQGVMTPAAATLGPGDNVVKAEALIRERGVNVLPVVDGEGRLLGEITRKTILKHIVLDVLGLECGCKEGK